ncbi:hypothetical protein J6590_102544, partial [Homalodisca vitripennis]
FTDQLFTGTGTGTGYCSERSDCSETRLEKLTVFWLFSVLPVSPWLANSPTFGRVPVSAVSGTGAASLPEQLKNGMPSSCQRYWTGIQPECSAPIHFFWNKVGLKMFFLLLILNLRGLGCRERCQMLDLEEGQYLASIYLVSYMT